MQQVVLFFFMSVSMFLKSQTVDSIAYSSEYEFKEGVFLNVEQFKNNNPIPKSSIVSVLPKNQLDFLTQVMEQKTFTYKDKEGVEQKLETNTVWGYCQNRTISINFNNEFNRINVIGTLSLFSGMVVHSPLNNEPIGDMYAIEPSFEDLQQFIFDTKTNKILDFNSKNLELLIKDDNELYTQFMKLKKRAKADSIFIYLRKYNQKHPLYLPVK